MNRKGTFGIYGKRTFSPSNLPLTMIAPIKLAPDFFPTNRMPLHSIRAFKHPRKEILEQNFNCKLYGGIPGVSSELKNSAG